MNISTALSQPLVRPQSRSQSLPSSLISRLKSLVSGTTDRTALGSAAAPPYSFLSECECPDDCLRDHENE